MKSSSPVLSDQASPTETPAHEQIRHVWRSTRRWCWIGCAMLLGSITWAVWSQPATQPAKAREDPRERVAEIPSGELSSTVNEAAFSSGIWRTPHKPTVEVSPPPPPPPLRLQLLAINSPLGQLPVAVIYDQELDVVVTLASGASYRGLGIVVSKDRVVLGVSDTSVQSTTLLLDPTAAPAAGGGPR